MRTLITTLLFLGLLAGCGKTQEAIEYGKDNCHFCQMKIMDPKFGAEAITDKGRCYKFDSAECLLRYLKEADVEHAHLYVTDFDHPETLVDAKLSHYLISKKMPSPMGAYLNAFIDVSRAEFHRKSNGGTIFDWDGIQSEFQ